MEQVNDWNTKIRYSLYINGELDEEDILTFKSIKDGVSFFDSLKERYLQNLLEEGDHYFYLYVKRELKDTIILNSDDARQVIKECLESIPFVNEFDREKLIEWLSLCCQYSSGYLHSLSEKELWELYGRMVEQ
jgi:hypothetical protein